MKKSNEPKRPGIPLPTQLRLWVVSAGRCEFPGCNEFLLTDKLTLNDGKYSNIAHIISWTPTGPRGDAKLSPKLAKDISNLMLVCLKHGKEIDLKKNLPLYPVEFLRKCKEAHENRISIQTSIDESRKTTVVRLHTNIRGRLVDVSELDTYNALITAGRYPKDRKGIYVDLTNIDYSTDKSSWETAVKQINTIIDKALTVGNNQEKEGHFSVFGIAPIPVLVYLGFKLGNTTPADIYIKLREKPWSIQSSQQNLKFLTKRPHSKTKSKIVGLSIAITGTTKEKEIRSHIGMVAPIYTISIKSPQVDQISCVEDLEAFRKTYREIIDEIREKHGKNCEIHLFGAMPTCASIVCGRELIHGVDPSLVVYEHTSQEEGFIKALKIN